MSDDALQHRFVQLLEEHRRIVYKVASLYGHTPDDRADIEQEIVVQLWRAFPRYDARFRYSTWMYRIALNVAISYRRGQHRRERLSVPTGPAILEVADEREPVETDPRLAELHAFIAALGELDRALMLLHLEGHRHDEIAEVLGISTSNVGTRFSRIKQRARAHFQQKA